MVMMMIMIELAMILLSDGIPEASEILPHLVSLYFLFDLLFGLEVAHALAEVSQRIFGYLPKLQGTSLIY